MEAYIMKMKPDPPEAPNLEAANNGDIRVRWKNPTGQAAFREVSVLMRRADEAVHRASSDEWCRVDSRTKTLMFDGWKNFPPLPSEVVVTGLDLDTPYEAMLDVLTVRGFQLQSEPSEVLRIGRAATSLAPILEDAGNATARVQWVLPAAEPPIERVLVFLRPVGNEEWLLVDNLTKTLIGSGFCGGQACPPMPSELLVTGIDAGRSYEARLAFLNEHGWSEPSPISPAVEISL